MIWSTRSQIIDVTHNTSVIQCLSYYFLIYCLSNKLIFHVKFKQMTFNIIIKHLISFSNIDYLTECHMIV